MGSCIVPGRKVNIDATFELTMNLAETKAKQLNTPPELKDIQMAVGQKAVYEILEMDRAVAKMR